MTHVLFAAVTFDDDHPSERTYLRRGTEAECIAGAEQVPGISYAGDRPNPRAWVTVREAADDDRCATLCRLAIGAAAREAAGDLSAALPMVGNPAPDALAPFVTAMQAFLLERSSTAGDEPPELLGFELAAALWKRSADGATFLRVCAFVQREAARSIRWDGVVDRTGRIVESWATFEPSFLVALDGPSCTSCRRPSGSNPDCIACVELASSPPPPTTEEI